jgi:Glycosyl transferase family 2
VSNRAKWDAWYRPVDSRQAYVDTITYRLGADFLSSCEVVEDWGCGLGWMRNFIPAERYVGLDGSASRFADRIVDLETYTSNVDGIFMRHVLEHNYAWEQLLLNALSSFRRRFVLVTFTPHGETTHVLDYQEDPGVPNISFAKTDITKHFDGLVWRDETYATDTQYGTETIFYVERVPRRSWFRRRARRPHPEPEAEPPDRSSDDARPWVRVEAVTADAQPLADFRLFGILGAWNEEDIVEATIQNAFTQGCDQVFLVDNASDDDTVPRALAAGAVLSRQYATERYDEELRMQHMQEIVESASAESGAAHVWWLWMDADELAHGRAGMTLRQQLRSLDRRFRVVGARYLNHYPSGAPQSRRGCHPIDFQPLAEEMIYGHCGLGHRKHPLQRWDANGPTITCGLGFHAASASVQLIEPRDAVILHHFPFRDESVTRARMEKLCASTDSEQSLRAWPDHPSTDHIWPRYKSLDAVYRQEWSEVIDFISGTKGVQLRPWTQLVEPDDIPIARWYFPDSQTALIDVLQRSSVELRQQLNAKGIEAEALTNELARARQENARIQQSVTIQLFRKMSDAFYGLVGRQSLLGRSVQALLRLIGRVLLRSARS